MIDSITVSKVDLTTNLYQCSWIITDLSALDVTLLDPSKTEVPGAISNLTTNPGACTLDLSGYASGSYTLSIVETLNSVAYVFVFAHVLQQVPDFLDATVIIQSPVFVVAWTPLVNLPTGALFQSFVTYPNSSTPVPNLVSALAQRNGLDTVSANLSSLPSAAYSVTLQYTSNGSIVATKTLPVNYSQVNPTVKFTDGQQFVVLPNTTALQNLQWTTTNATSVIVTGTGPVGSANPTLFTVANGRISQVQFNENNNIQQQLGSAKLDFSNLVPGFYRFTVTASNGTSSVSQIQSFEYQRTPGILNIQFQGTWPLYQVSYDTFDILNLQASVVDLLNLGTPLNVVTNVSTTGLTLNLASLAVPNNYPIDHDYRLNFTGIQSTSSSTLNLTQQESLPSVVSYVLSVPLYIKPTSASFVYTEPNQYVTFQAQNVGSVTAIITDSTGLVIFTRVLEEGGEYSPDPDVAGQVNGIYYFNNYVYPTDGPYTLTLRLRPLVSSPANNTVNAYFYTDLTYAIQAVASQLITIQNLTNVTGPGNNFYTFVWQETNVTSRSANVKSITQPLEADYTYSPTNDVFVSLGASTIIVNNTTLQVQGQVVIDTNKLDILGPYLLTIAVDNASNAFAGVQTSSIQFIIS